MYRIFKPRKYFLKQNIFKRSFFKKSAKDRSVNMPKDRSTYIIDGPVEMVSGLFTGTGTILTLYVALIAGGTTIALFGLYKLGEFSYRKIKDKINKDSETDSKN